MSGGGSTIGSGVPSPQSLDAVIKAGLPVYSRSSIVSGEGSLIQNLDAVRAAGLPMTTDAPTTDFLSILKSLQAKKPNSALEAVEGAGLPTNGTEAPTGYADGGILGLGQGNINGQQVNPQFNTQSSYNNYASPNQSQGLMDYPQQGQPNQPLTSNVPPVQNSPDPDMWGGSPSTNMGFDNSGSDAGVGGQPVGQMQTPLQGQPPRLSQYMSQQGLQIQGNPTSTPLQRPQQR